MTEHETKKPTKPKRSFGDRLAWVALAALVSAIAVLYIYYRGF